MKIALTKLKGYKSGDKNVYECGVCGDLLVGYSKQHIRKKHKHDKKQKTTEILSAKRGAERTRREFVIQ